MSINAGDATAALIERRAAEHAASAISTLTEARLWPTETYCCSRCFAPAAMRDGAWGHVDPADDAVCRGRHPMAAGVSRAPAAMTGSGGCRTRISSSR